MEQTFDPVALAELVDRALSEEVPASCAPLSLYEGRLLERFAAVLPRHLGPTATRAVLRELRGELDTNPGMDLPKLQRVIQKCTRCPGLSPPPHLCLGNTTDPDVVIVVDSLATVNEREIWSRLETAGIVRHRAAITATTRCTGAVGADDIGRCSEFLTAEIEILKPDLILAFGSIPAQVLLGPGVKISEARGRLWWVGPWAVLPTFSPGFAARGGHAEEEFHTDLAAARHFLDG